MRMRIVDSLLAGLIVALLAMPAGADPIDRRASLGPTRAAALESVVNATFPGSRLTWTDRITVTLADGTKSTVRMPGTVELSRPAGPLLIVAVEFPDFAEAAVRQAAAFADPPPNVADVLATVQLDASSHVVSQKLSRVDATAIANEVKELELNGDEPGSPPTVTVTYWSTYRSTDWYGALRWTDVVECVNFTHFMRLPVSIRKVRRTGGGFEDIVSIERTAPAVLHVQGPLTSRDFDFPCESPCILDGRSLLASW